MRLSEIKTDIDAICERYEIANYTINDDGSIDVEGDVNLSESIFTELPLKFGHVNGVFSCSSCPNLTSLKGAPTSINGNFYCSSCPKLTSLEYAPTSITGIFYCSNCPALTSLKGAPTSITGISGNFHCSFCVNLTSLEGAPTSVTGDFNCSNCVNLTSLEGAPTFVGGDFSCAHCFKLTKLSHIKSAKSLYIKDTPISNLLYVFKIKGLKYVKTKIGDLNDIINKYLTGNHDIMDCQEELIEAGFEKIAKLK